MAADGVFPVLLAKVPPAPPSDQTAAVAPPPKEPPRAVVVPPWQTAPRVPPALTVGFALIDMVTTFEVAGLPAAQSAFEVSRQLTMSLFAGVYVYVGLFVPTVVPFTFHWYAGAVPPLVGAAVKVTEVDGQTGFDEGVINRLTGRVGFIVIELVAVTWLQPPAAGMVLVTV